MRLPQTSIARGTRPAQADRQILRFAQHDGGAILGDPGDHQLTSFAIR